MRIWDIHPGYLNHQSLLGEHRELHGIISIIVHGKKGYSRHPETLRWVGYGWALKKRHQLLSAEMSLRHFTDKTPVYTRSNKGEWPKTYIDEPQAQFSILAAKYRDKDQGRIPLPENIQQLWSQHKYSVMARDLSMYKTIGRGVAGPQSSYDFHTLAELLVKLLQARPSPGGVRNALQHMWGHVSQSFVKPKHCMESWSLKKLFLETQRLALSTQEPYLMSSTALSELQIWTTP